MRESVCTPHRKCIMFILMGKLYRNGPFWQMCWCAVVNDDIPERLQVKFTHTFADTHTHSFSPMCFGTALRSCWNARQGLCARSPGWSADTRTPSAQTAAGGGSSPVVWWASPRWPAPGSYPPAVTGDTPVRETKWMGRWRVACYYGFKYQVMLVDLLLLRVYPFFTLHSYEKDNEKPNIFNWVHSGW